MIRTDLHAIYYEGLLSETHHEEGCALSGVTSISSSFILMKMFSDKLNISAATTHIQKYSMVDPKVMSYYHVIPSSLLSWLYVGGGLSPCDDTVIGQEHIHSQHFCSCPVLIPVPL